MNALERTARDLAAVLSSGGEDDWQRFVPLAREVRRRIERQFETVMFDDAEHSGSAELSNRDDSTQRIKPQS